MADSILDFCSVPPNDDAKIACLRILTKFSACPPKQAVEHFVKPFPSSVDAETSPKPKGGGVRDIDRALDHAVAKHGLSLDAAQRMRTFLGHGCLPLSSNAEAALDAIQAAARRLRVLDLQNGDDIGGKRTKKYEDIGKGLKSLRMVLKAMDAIGLFEASRKTAAMRCAGRPAYISIDLGLRQLKKHIHGNLFFQAVLLQSNCFDKGKSSQDYIEKSETQIVPTCSDGVRIAEGGRYDDLVSGNSC